MHGDKVNDHADKKSDNQNSHAADWLFFFFPGRIFTGHDPAGTQPGGNGGKHHDRLVGILFGVKLGKAQGREPLRIEIGNSEVT